MLNKLPWFNSRKRFIIASLSDLFVFHGFIYRYSFYNQMNNRNIIEMIFFLITWVVASYVIGRYAVPEKRLLVLIMRQVFTAILLALILILLYSFYYVIITNNNDSLYIGLIYKLSFLPVSISIIIQSLINIALNKLNIKKQKWVLIGSPEKAKILINELNYSRLNAKVEHITDDFDFYSMEVIDGFIIDDLSYINNDKIERIVTWKSKGYEIINIFDWCEKILQRYPPDLINKDVFLSIDFSSTNNIFRFRLKRSGEFILSIILLFLLSPLLLIASLFITLEDNGPILYSQFRTGMKGRKFKIYKLRTMRIDAEKQGPQWAAREDNRITRIGKILRKTRIDELPQLWSVLSGEMSLIGPRPERPEIEEGLMQQIPNYHLRFCIKPGLSGWAQVNYPYGASVEDTRKKLSYDLYYLKNFSIILDFLILLKTIRLVLNASGSRPLN